jgi:metal-sulfur cluster biosynthetic enzyme
MINRSELSELERRALVHLHEVIDPEIGLNIVDLGLVYSLSINEEAKSIYVEMTLTTQFCPMGDSILKSVEETLNDYYPGYQAEVKLVFEPRWDAGMISEEGQAFLG